MSVIKEIRAELNDLKPSSKDVRIFAVILAAIFTFVGWRVFGNQFPWSCLAYTAATVALVLAAVAWQSLLGTYRAWMGLAIVLGSVVTRVILGVAYLVMILPIGVFFRLTGKDPMRRKLEPDAKTYWLPVAPIADRASYLRKF